jgi:serine/threonine-protein kinase
MAMDRGRIATPVPSGASPRDTVRAVADDAPPTDEVVADLYEVRELLGLGAMGQVYEAHDRQLNRRVALKVVVPGADPASLRREGQALAAIRHPSVVSVYSMGSHRGIDFLVMERVLGVSLEALLEQRRRRGELLAVPEAIDIIVLVAEGLAAVHAAGLAHRDVKPANVMMAPGNRVVLMDFGLMHLQRDAPPESLGYVVGSLPYMAPESLTFGVAYGAGHLLDLYALGVLSFEILTGILPYDTPDIATLMRAHRRGSPPRAAELRRDVPPALSDFVGSLMAFDPAERPQSADVALWQLRKLRDRASLPAPDPRFSVVIAQHDATAFDALTLYVRAVIADAEIVCVTRGDDAIRSIRKRAPDVLLLDLELPDTNAVEVCMYVRGLSRGERCFVLCTGEEGSDADVQLLRQLGARFLTKGADRMTEIVEMLQKVRPS